MIGFLKKLVLRFLDARDLILLRKDEYQYLLAAGSALSNAKAAGIYIPGTEAPVDSSQRVSTTIAKDAQLVILTFGQSNAANAGETRYTARNAVYAFNFLDMNFYRASDPLPGASNDGGSIWGILGDKLIDAGLCRSVLFIPIAYGGSFISEWSVGGVLHRRLKLAVERTKATGLNVDLLFWQQGEAEANCTNMLAREYKELFRSMLDTIREDGIGAPVYVAIATLCANAVHPYDNREQIRDAQESLLSHDDRIFPGPDTDRIGIEHRFDGCHFSASGLELAAQAWFEAVRGDAVLCGEPARIQK